MIDIAFGIICALPLVAVLVRILMGEDTLGTDAIAVLMSRPGKED